MSVKLDTVSRFSPGNCAPELLESILVGRHDLVDRMEKSVLDSLETGAGHHCLLIGPRGAGKTHLLAILHNRIDANEDVRSRFAVAYLKEEERGVASFLDWLVRVLRAFHRRGEEPASEDNGFNLGEKLDSLKRMPLDQAQAEAEKALVEFVGGRRLLLIAENLGEIFSETKGMGREGQQRLRDLVQQHPFWTIAASSQALFEDVQAHEAPFYGFFKIHHLPMLTLEESNELLRNLARLEGRQQLQRFFSTEAGRGRIRAIHELTGGSPRLLVIFYQFVERDSIEDLATPFLEMVDSLTSYYQEQMHPLPALQQKIVEFLCEHRSPATVKEVAQSCFITHQTASSQLKRLTKRRYVQSIPMGREVFYELREPLFRICFEVKENLGYPIRLFVDFLGKFYSVEELRRQYRATSVLRSIYENSSTDPLARKVERDLGYIAEALSVHYSASYRETEVEAATLQGAGPDQIAEMVNELISEQDYRSAARLAEAVYSENLGGPEFLLKSAQSRRQLGDSKGARERLEQLTRSEPENIEAWIELAEIASDDPDTAESCYRRALDLDARNERALVGLGYIRGNQGDHRAALECFERVTDLRPENGISWRNLGLAQEKTGDTEGARASYERATQVAPEDPDAWMYRGMLSGGQGGHRAALECFERVTELRLEDPVGWWARGLVQEKYGDFEGAEASYERLTQLAPEVPAGWSGRACMAARRDDREVALRLLRKAAALDTEPASEYNSRGEVYRLLGLYSEAIRQYHRALELDPSDCYAQFNVVLSLFQAGDQEAGLRRMEIAAETEAAEGWEIDLPECIKEINEYLFRNTDVDHLAEVIHRQREIFEGNPLRDPFTAGLTAALMGLIQQRDEVSLERLIEIRDQLIPKLAEDDDLSVACRLLETGVTRLETGDPRVLLQLPLEERRSLEEILGKVS